MVNWRAMDRCGQTLLIFRRSLRSGGAERAAIRLADQLGSLFDDVRLLTEGTAFMGKSINGGWGPGWLRLIFYAASANAMNRSIPGGVMTLSMERGIRAHIYRAGEGVHLAWMKRKGMAKSILSFRALHPVAIWLERISVDTAKFIVANSEMVAAELTRFYPQHAGKIRVIENGFDPNRFFVDEEITREKENGAGERRLCFAGNGWDRKGLDRTIQLLSVLSSEWKLWVLGKGNESKFRQMADDLKCSDRVRFEGEVTDVAGFLRRSDAFILPTRYDPFSNACLEAAACGCPVITTKANGFASLVQHGENGFILEEDNLTDCQNWMEQDLPVDRERIALSVSEFTIVNETSKYMRLFQQLSGSTMEAG